MVRGSSAFMGHISSGEGALDLLMRSSTTSCSSMAEGSKPPYEARFSCSEGTGRAFANARCSVRVRLCARTTLFGLAIEVSNSLPARSNLDRDQTRGRFRWRTATFCKPMQTESTGGERLVASYCCLLSTIMARRYCSNSIIMILPTDLIEIQLKCSKVNGLYCISPYIAIANFTPATQD